MKIESALHEGIFLKRYKRFFADVEWQGEVIQAHVANTGSLLEVISAGVPCKFTLNQDPKRKLKASLQRIKTGETWVGINTQIPNQLVGEALEKRLLPVPFQYDSVKPEYKISKETRLDFALLKENKPVHFLEVKSVTMARNGVALFPDAVTSRGLKHLETMSTICRNGGSAEMLYIVQRNDCSSFSIAKDIDPDYYQGLQAAMLNGLKVSVYLVRLSEDQIELDTSTKVIYQP